MATFTSEPTFTSDADAYLLYRDFRWMDYKPCDNRLEEHFDAMHAFYVKHLYYSMYREWAWEKLGQWAERYLGWTWEYEEQEKPVEENYGAPWDYAEEPILPDEDEDEDEEDEDEWEGYEEDGFLKMVVKNAFFEQGLDNPFLNDEDDREEEDRDGEGLIEYYTCPDCGAILGDDESGLFVICPKCGKDNPFLH